MTGFFEFERAAAPRLKEIFERDLNWTIPVKMMSNWTDFVFGGTASEGGPPSL